MREVIGEVIADDLKKAGWRKTVTRPTPAAY